MSIITIDTSVILAIITNETTKQRLIEITINAQLISPESTYWEIGNALSAMFKRKQVTLDQAIEALEIYHAIPIRSITVELLPAVKIAHRLNIYAYDAYLMECAIKHKTPLLTLDSKLATLAEQEEIQTIKLR